MFLPALVDAMLGSDPKGVGIDRKERVRRDR